MRERKRTEREVDDKKDIEKQRYGTMTYQDVTGRVERSALRPGTAAVRVLDTKTKERFR